MISVDNLHDVSEVLDFLQALYNSHGNLRTAVKTKTGMKSKSVAEAAKLLEKVKARLKMGAKQ